MRGPPKLTDVPSDQSFEQKEEIATNLINDDKMSICRSSGIKHHKWYHSSNNDRRQPSSTVTRPDKIVRDRPNKRSWGSKQYNNYDRSNARSIHRYDNKIEGWDSDLESDTDHSRENIAMTNKQRMVRYKDQKEVSHSSRYAHDTSHEQKDNGWQRRNRDEDWQPTRYDKGRLYDRRQRDRSWESTQSRDTRDRKRNTEKYRGRTGSSDSLNSDSDRGKGVRSGISTRPTSNVHKQLKYPHYSLGQVSGFIGQNLQFHHLSYEHFIAGELSTITTADDPAEVEGCTELLQRIALWKLRTNVSWQQVRNAYAHIIRKIENKEIGWDADWDRFE